MKRIWLSLLIVVAVALIGCKNDQKGEYMDWKDGYFMEICSQVFDKAGDEITYEDVSLIEKVVFINVDGQTKVGVSLSNDPEMKIVAYPKEPLRSIEDLAWFKNLTELEVFNNQFSKAETLKEMPRLKTLLLSGPKLTAEQLKKIAKNSYIESLQIEDFHNIDYSCLAEMTTLRRISFKYCFEDTYDRSKGYYSSLQSLPIENCLLDLSSIDHDILTPELYEVLRTHPNIERLGVLQITGACDLEFFKDMEHLDTVMLRGGELDLTGISQMTWLKHLSLWGEDIDISLLQQLPELEYLELKEHSGDRGIPPVLSIRSLGVHKRLQTLSLSGYIMEDLDGIEDYPDLKTFIGNDLSLEDIDSLKALSDLEYLDLTYNLITDIDAVKDLKRLRYLALGWNEIKDIGPLGGCTGLEYLDLSGNYVTDISPIYGFQRLKELRAETRFPKKDRDYTEDDREVIAWREVLSSLSGLRYYVGGPPIDTLDTQRWLSEHLPNVKYGYSDVG